MLDIKKENKIFDFFRLRHSLMLTSYEISEIVNEVSNNEIEIINQINKRIYYYRFINLSIVLLILLLFKKDFIYYGMIFYFLLNVSILIYQILKDKLKKWK